MLTGIAKPMPWPFGIIAVLMPITSPRMLRRGPPELPGLIGASVWMKVIVGTGADDPALGAHDACGNGIAEAEGVPDGEDPFTHAGAVGITEDRGLERSLCLPS